MILETSLKYHSISGLPKAYALCKGGIKNGVAFFAKTSFIDWLSVFINLFSVYARSLRLHPTVWGLP